MRVTTGDFVNGVFRVARSCKSAELQAMLHLEDELCLVRASSLEVERGVRQLPQQKPREVTGQVVALIVMDSRDLRDRATSICATISGARVRGTRWSERFYDSNCDEAER